MRGRGVQHRWHVTDHSQDFRDGWNAHPHSASHQKRARSLSDRFNFRVAEWNANQHQLGNICFLSDDYIDMGELPPPISRDDCRRASLMPHSEQPRIIWNTECESLIYTSSDYLGKNFDTRSQRQIVGGRGQDRLLFVRQAR
jgi:hypothetical protein